LAFYFHIVVKYISHPRISSVKLLSAFLLNLVVATDAMKACKGIKVQ
jgi:hypothetical protein